MILNYILNQYIFFNAYYYLQTVATVKRGNGVNMKIIMTFVFVHSIQIIQWFRREIGTFL